jgi:hypothetical protein
MNDGERQLLGAVVICGMLVGALLATWPRGTPATISPSTPVCSVTENLPMASERTRSLWPDDRSCQDQHAR